MSCCICCCGRRPVTSCKRTDAVADTDEAGPFGFNALSGHDVKLLKDSSEVIFNKMHLENKGVAFLIQFFKQFPEHQSSFKAFRNIPPDELYNLPKANNHGRKVMDQIALVIVHIEEPEAMKVQLTGLRERHTRRRVYVSQMRDMIFSFVSFARTEMGSRFNTEIEAAWNRLLGVVINIMEEDENEARRMEPFPTTTPEPHDTECNFHNEILKVPHEQQQSDQKHTDIQKEHPVVTSEVVSDAAPNDVSIKVTSNGGQIALPVSSCVDTKNNSNGSRSSSGVVDTQEMMRV